MMRNLRKNVSDRAIQIMTVVHGKTVSGRRARRLAMALADVIPPNKRILDVGCGNGKLAKLILELRPDLEICGIDVKCDQNAAIPITKYDGHTIPFESDSWEICMASDVLHHCTDPIEVLTEMKRVASQSIIIKDHTAESRFTRSILGLMDWVGNYGYGTDVPFNFMSAAQWRKAYADLGLSETTLRTRLRLYPYPFTWIFDRSLHFVALLTIPK